MIYNVKEYHLHSFNMDYSQLKAPIVRSEQLTLTTFNGGILPNWINSAQKLGQTLNGFFSSVTNKNLEKSPKLLDSPAQRVPLIGKKLAERADDIFCGQEVFDKQAAQVLTAYLRNTHSVLYNIGCGSIVNSGLFFASRYPILIDEVRFWRFTNLAAEDNLSDKGVLRIPVSIPSAEGSNLVVVYITHLQAKLGEKYTKIRQEQAEAIRTIVLQDQNKNNCPHFVLGDLNITDIESDGSQPNEYSQLQESFFSSFHDFYLMDHDKQGNRIKDEALYVSKNEPKGSFYAMEEFGSGKELPQVRYDYCLLYQKDKKDESFTNLTSHSELCRWMEPNLSDHLPLTTVVNTQQLFSFYKS